MIEVKVFLLDFGASFTLGENIGDYSVGFNIEAGFVKRMNRVFSIGPSISYLSFEYDPEETGGCNNVLFRLVGPIKIRREINITKAFISIYRVERLSLIPLPESEVEFYSC